MLYPHQPELGRDVPWPPTPQLRLLLALQDAHLSLGTTVTPGPELPAATGEGQLLAWAQGAYGGITSYSELRDPRWVQVRLGEGAWGRGLVLGGNRVGSSPCSQQMTTRWEDAQSQGRCYGD